MTIIYQTSRLRVRAFTHDDAAFIQKLLNEPGFIQNIADKGVRSCEDAINYLDSVPLASYEKYGYGLWCMELKETGQPVGMCGLVKRDYLAHPDIGYAILSDFYRQGLTAEAVAGTIAWARDEMDMPALLGIVNVGNEASQKVLEGAGLSYQGLVEPAPDMPSLQLYKILL
ncbi:GNAT family N-acetyltransferase [Parasalinivibrio latis]|uniref:GNAT family N-acetyltransferase n=1 Tax=Parasalinivibrio latis TaxID=2952610 RepID=UPI0030E08C57